jgi:uncharacterized membrane protein
MLNFKKITNALDNSFWGKIFWKKHMMIVKRQEEFEVIRNRISKKNIQHNGQKKKYKKTNNELQNIHIKLKIVTYI